MADPEVTAVPPTVGALARVEALLEAGRAREAADAARKAVGAEPDNHDAWCLLTAALIDSQEGRRAFDAARRAVALDAEDEWGHRLLSMAAELAGHHDTAVSAAYEAVRLEPDEWQTHARLAHALHEKPATWDRAWQAANEAVRLAPDEADAHFIVGCVAVERGMLPTAEQAFRRTLEIDPDHAGALNNLGLVALRGGSPIEAASGFQSAMVADPTMNLARDNIDQAVLVFLARAHWVLWGVYFIVLRIGRALAPWMPPLLVLACLGVAAWWAPRLYRRVPAGLRPYLRRLPLRNFWVGFWAACQLVALAAMAAVLVVPPGMRVAVLGVGGLALGAGAVMSWVLFGVEKVRQRRARR